MWKVVKMVMFFFWSLLLTLTALSLPTHTEVVKVEELPDDPRSFLPIPVYPSVKYQILNAEPLLLRDAGRDLIGNASLQAQRQTFMLSSVSGQQPPPSINASYGLMSVERAIPQELLQTGPRIRAFILAKQVRSSAPIMRVLFHSARSESNPRNASVGETGPKGAAGKGGYICVMTYAFWETREVRGACSLPAEGGSCLARLKPEPTWFGLGSGRSSQENQSEGKGNTVELYYQSRPSPTSQCSPQDGQARRGQLGQAAPRYRVSGPRMKSIGSLTLLRSPPGNPTFMRVRLGGTVVIQTSSKPVKTTDTATFYVFLPSASPVERFILRTTVKKGLSFSAARPSDPGLWDITLEPAKGDEPQPLYVVCQKKSTLSGKRGLLEVLQLDFEAEEFSDQSEGQLITWRLELPGNIKDEGSMRIYTTQKDFIGLAPLIMDTELLNTAILTGRRVSVPVAILAVEADGSVTDITNSTSCLSTDTDILKVSKRCDFVYMDGKETGGRVRMLVNFTYSYLSAQLEVSVWMPRLPLRIELSDTELSQIKGWRVPVSAINQRKSSWDSEEEEDRKGRGCMLQYQHALVRVLTPFLADADDPAGGTAASLPAYFLGPEWQVDVTRLVQDSMRVGDPSVARLQSDTVLAGRAVGVTSVQVMSPLLDLVLAERVVRVLDDKVSITELGVQLVSGLALNLQLSPGSNRAIVATATTQELMQSLKQEALISAWLQFSDGSMTPLDLYDPGLFMLSATSLNERVVAVRQDPVWKWPVIVTKGEGQGQLVRVEMFNPEACQKSKRRSVLATGTGSVHIRFGRDDDAAEGRSGDRRYRPNAPYYGGSISDVEAGIMNRGSTTKTAAPGRPSGGRLSADAGLNVPVDFSEFPTQAELPSGRSTDDELLQTRRGLSDLEIGMYALLGVFCLAILVFLINCISYALKYRNKQLPLDGQETMAHAHDWVWLGHEGELLEGPHGLCLQQEDLGSILDSGLGLEEGSQLLNGVSMQKSVQGQVHRSALDMGVCPGKEHKSESLNSPTTKRKRVKFTTFGSSKSNNGCPAISPLVLAQNNDIKWVCPDIELGDSKELRNYMERLNENASKSLA